MLELDGYNRYGRCSRSKVLLFLSIGVDSILFGCLYTNTFSIMLSVPVVNG